MYIALMYLERRVSQILDIEALVFVLLYVKDGN